MTLDEAIEYEEELAKFYSWGCGDIKRKRECLQIVEWLKDYKRLKEQEPKAGHWIDSSNGWMCSECKCDNTFDTNYCPNCGAEMVESQESENKV